MSVSWSIPRGVPWDMLGAASLGKLRLLSKAWMHLQREQTCTGQLTVVGTTAPVSGAQRGARLPTSQLMFSSKLPALRRATTSAHHSHSSTTSPASPSPAGQGCARQSCRQGGKCSWMPERGERGGDATKPRCAAAPQVLPKRSVPLLTWLSGSCVCRIPGK